MADLGKILAGNLQRIRKKVAGTQEAFAEKSGLSQPQVSRLEKAKGWTALRNLAQAIEKAGGDPLDLLRLEEPADAATAEIRRLLAEVDDDTRQLVLGLLRREAQLLRRVAAQSAAPAVESAAEKAD